MKCIRTWVLIADAGHARVLESDGKGSGLKQVQGLVLSHHTPAAHDLVDDRQPRSFESVGMARHAISGGVDPRRKDKRRFAEEIAEILDRRLESKEFDRLVVAAPPQALGDLRDCLSEAVKGRVVNEVAKDLTKTPNGEIASHLNLTFAL